VLELGLCLALVSAITVNWAYAREHDAAAELPELTFSHWRESLRLLLGARAWVRAFAVETVGFLLYVAALWLAPLSLVQAVAASGIAALAVFSCHGRLGQLSWRERAAVFFAVAGLVLLGLSLTGEPQQDSAPSAFWVFVWLASCAGGALLAARVLPFGKPAARYGFAAGLLFAAGDISSKLVGLGGEWVLALLSLIVGYGLGTSTLQGAFQRGGALTAAGIATLTTNAVPMAAGFVLFGEQLPAGARGVLQVAAFASVVVSATLLGRRA
jgi:hypothetical protein